MPYDRVVGLCSTDSIAIRQEIEELAALVAKQPKIEPGSVQVRLREGQEEKPKAQIRALILTSKWEEFLVVQQDIDLVLRDNILAAEKAYKAAEQAKASNVFPLKDPEEDEKVRATGAV
jgi:MscS family membrane protein